LSSAAPSRPSDIRRFLKRVPGVSWLASCFLEGPGSWLFRKTTSGWLGDPALSAQLPPSYRAFARFCSAQPGNPLGAEILLRFLIWFRRQRGSESACRLEIQGKSIFVDLSDPRFLAIPRELTTGLPRILKTLLRPGDTFIDVGSNHGTFAVTAAQIVGPSGQVIAIEPQSRLASLVRRSLALYDAPAVVHRVACGRAPGTVTLYIPTATSGSGGLHADYSATSPHRTETVPLVRLDDLLSNLRLPGRVLVKLDVEGSEGGFLAGAPNFLASAKPAILMEINPTALAAAGSSPAAITAALRESGYDRFLGGSNFDLEQPLTSPTLYSNILVLHKSVE